VKGGENTEGSALENHERPTLFVKINNQKDKPYGDKQYINPALRKTGRLQGGTAFSGDEVPADGGGS
jgi:hypothetical protein